MTNQTTDQTVDTATGADVTMDTTIAELAAAYCDVWNEAHPQRRGELARALFTEDAGYVDPLVEVSGRDALVAAIGAVQEQFPGLRFTPTGFADGHHQFGRFGWNLGTPEVPDLVVGFDVVRRAADGRIAGVAGFLDKVPADLGGAA